MAYSDDNQKVSNLPSKTSLLGQNDLFYVIEDNYYGGFLSKNISYKNITDSLKRQFIDNNEFEFVLSGNNLIWKSSHDGVTKTVDASIFIKDGILENVEYDKENHQMLFIFNQESKQKTISVDVSDFVKMYKPAYGLTSDINFNVSVDTSVISEIGHKHVISDITGLNDELANKSSLNHTHDISSINDLKDTIDSINSNIENKSGIGHTHVISSIDNLQSTINRINDSINNKANTDHSHEISDISQLDNEIEQIKTSLNNKIEQTDLSDYLKKEDYHELSAGNGLKIENYTISLSSHQEYNAGYGIDINDENVISLKRPTVYKSVFESSRINVDFSLSSNYDVYYFPNVDQSSYDFTNLNVPDDYIDGIYTWEMIIRNNQEVQNLVFSDNVKYVGNDLSVLVDKDHIKENETAVFAVRLLRLSGKDTWNVNFCYKF